MKQHNHGFTLIELMVTVAIVAILAGLAYPSFLKQIEASRLQAAAESVYQALRLGRSEALRLSQDVYIILNNSGESNWALSVSKTADCDATDTTKTCHVQSMAPMLANDFPGMTVSGTGFAISGLKATMKVSTSSATPEIQVTSTSGMVLSIRASTTGLLNLCSRTTYITRYPACPA